MSLIVQLNQEQNYLCKLRTQALGCPEDLRIHYKNVIQMSKIHIIILKSMIMNSIILEESGVIDVF